MRRGLLALCAAQLVATVAAPTAVVAQGRAIRGSVVDPSGAPIPFANVIASASGRLVVASAEGRFRLPLDSASNRTIDVRRIGFHPRTVVFDVWPDTSVVIVLEAAARTLAGVRVSADRVQSLAIRGFYERMAEVERGINHGYFITPEEIESRPSAKATDFVARLPAIRIRRIRERGRNGKVTLQIQGVDGCRMTVYVDGIRFFHVDPTYGIGPGTGSIDDLVSTNTIAAIEVYPRPVGSPPRYQSLNGTCGVVLIWTR